MASSRLGHIYVVHTVLSKPPKPKFALCVCEQRGYFLWINSKPRPHGHDQLLIPADCHTLVRHVSYLDLSHVVVHPAAEIDSAREFERISSDLCRSILAMIEGGLRLLPKRHADVIYHNLGQLVL